MLRIILFCWLALAAPAAAVAQAPATEADPWSRGSDRITFAAAEVSFPLRAGITSLNQATEASRQGQGVDNVLHYVSADGGVFVTVYVYYPGLSHAGLTAFMTDDVIHLQSRDLRELGSRITNAGGREGVAIRNDYAGFRDGLASSAAFLKLGRWIVKLRVSGPGDRRSDVEAAMTALLEGIRFEGRLQPRPAAPLEVSECEGAAPAAARALATDATQAAVESMVAIFDAGGEEARDPQGNRVDPLPPRLGTQWCRSAPLNVGDSSYVVLRTTAGDSSGGLGGRSVLVVPVNDAGTTLELVQTMEAGRFTLLFHEIGRTSVLGSYDGTLSDEQVAGILSGSDREGGRIRASIDLLPNGNTNIQVREVPTARPADPAT